MWLPEAAVDLVKHGARAPQNMFFCARWREGGGMGMGRGESFGKKVRKHGHFEGARKF